MIYFREANEPAFSKKAPDFRFWHVEYYDSEASGGKVFPVGCAYVTETIGRSAQMNYIIVADEWRRRGIGKAMMRAMMERWPSLELTPAINEVGESLYNSLAHGLRR